MIGAPRALLGLLAIAVPVLIHLLGRHQSRVLKFPTLRFIPASRLAPTRRRRISDWPLLLVRAGIVAAAALALSQPYFAFDGREASAASGTLSRAIVLDTSPSMRGVADSANAIAASASQVGTSTVIRTDDLRHGVRGALAWLAERRGAREMAVISDFQVAAMDVAEFASVDSTIGISLTVIPSPPVIPSGARELLSSESRSLASLGMTRVTYGPAPVLAGATTIDTPWMGAIVANLQRDPTLRDAALLSSASQPTGLDTVATGDRGQPVIGAGQVGDTLLLVVHDDSLSLTAAALTDALTRAMNPAIRLAESDTARVPAAALARWNRPALPGVSAPEDASDARWLWALALVLIVVEGMMRRRAVRAAPAAPAAEPEVERAA